MVVSRAGAPRCRTAATPPAAARQRGQRAHLDLRARRRGGHVASASARTSPSPPYSLAEHALAPHRTPNAGDLRRRGAAELISGKCDAATVRRYLELATRAFRVRLARSGRRRPARPTRRRRARPGNERRRRGAAPLFTDEMMTPCCRSVAGRGEDVDARSTGRLRPQRHPSLERRELAVAPGSGPTKCDQSRSSQR